MPAPPTSTWGRRLAYLYFLRFSLLLWLSMIVLWVFDLEAVNVTTTATRGILTQQNWKQAFWVAFFVVIAGWVALLSARVVCGYGEERFGPAPPNGLKVGTDMSYRTFLGAQIPGLTLLIYVGQCTVTDGMRPVIETIAALCGGGLLALVIWYFLAAYYYWTYEPRGTLVREGRLAPDEAMLRALPNTPLEAKAFLAPVSRCPWFEGLHNNPPPAISRVFDAIFLLVARHFGPGFRKDPSDPDSPLNAGHALAILLLSFLLFLYFVFFYHTAPVYMARARATVAIIVSVGLAIWFIAAFRYWLRLLHTLPAADAQPGSTAKSVGKSILRSAWLLFPVWYLIVLAWTGHRNESFPVLASIYMLLLFALWGLGGLAFLFDRARVPVLTGALLIIGGLHFVAHLPCLQGTWFGEAQHIVQTDWHGPTQVQFPDDILASFRETRRTAEGNPPILIVTATGGGIHAASWTAQLLGQLEAAFQADPSIKAWNAAHPQQQVLFHRSILLMSTVSGGSVGTAEWLRTYSNEASFPDFGVDGKAVAECSSLEAIGWGLVYPDAIHLVVPFRWGGKLENFDRSWALQAAIERNEESRCGKQPETALKNRPTLAGLAETLRDPSSFVPAFSLNTTVAETGDRLLLANYHVRYSGNPFSEILPANSFLDIYPAPPSQPGLVDLPITAAARLSASFPYVSSMPRVPQEVIARAYHFGDGGYFDNDGTGTAIEFLLQAYNPHKLGPGAPANPPPTRDRVFLLEIRNADNPLANKAPDSADDQNPPPGSGQQNAGKSWGTLNQLVGPLQTFYSAGHESVTRRNRRELCVMEMALQDHIQLSHYVFEYKPEPPRTEPLNWHLTEADKREISGQVTQRQPLVAKAAADFGQALGAKPPANSGSIPDCIAVARP